RRPALPCFHQKRDADVHCMNVQALNATRNSIVILPAPMLLHEGRRTPPFSERGWLYELKFDGYRLVAGVHDGSVVLNTRNGANATSWFPEIVEGLRGLSGGPHVIDGEVCVL